MTARKINFYLSTLGASDQQGLFAQADQLILMQRALIESIPPQLAKFCSLGEFSGGNLTLYAGNGAIAAKLRQISPSLLLKFRKKGYEVTAIRIAVQAHIHTEGMDNSAAKKLQIGQAGVESLNQLAAELPSSPLKMAIESLLKKQAKQQKNPDKGRCNTE